MSRTSFLVPTHHTLDLRCGCKTRGHESRGLGSKGLHAGPCHMLSQARYGGSTGHQITEFVVDLVHLCDDQAAAIAGVSALLAPRGMRHRRQGKPDRVQPPHLPVCRVSTGYALRTHTAHQALHDHSVEGGHEPEHVQSEVAKAARYVEDAVGLHRGEDLVA